MKKKLYLFFVALLCVLPAVFNAQSSSYKQAMSQQIRSLENAKGVSGYRDCAEGFEKIAKDEKNDWLSYYYAGVCNTLVAFEKKGKDIDNWCDKADVFAKKADSLNSKNCEVLVLKSMIACARIGVQPKQRGQKYATQANKFCKEALSLDEKNPRAHLQKATVIYYTPELFGGGPKKAKVYFDTAIQKFNEFKPLSSLAPDWGKDRAEKLLKECSAKLKN